MFRAQKFPAVFEALSANSSKEMQPEGSPWMGCWRTQWGSSWQLWRQWHLLFILFYWAWHSRKSQQYLQPKAQAHRYLLQRAHPGKWLTQGHPGRILWWRTGRPVNGPCLQQPKLREWDAFWQCALSTPTAVAFQCTVIWNNSLKWPDSGQGAPREVDEFLVKIIIVASGHSSNRHIIE